MSGEQGILYRLRVVGQEAVAQALQVTQDKVKGLDEATKQQLATLRQQASATVESTRRNRELSSAAHDMRQKYHALSTALSMTASMTAQLNPEFGKLSQQMAQTVTSAISLGSAFGPLGAAAAVVVSAFNFVTESLADADEALRTVARSSVTAVHSFETLYDRIIRTQREAARTARIRAGGGTLEENQARMEQINEEGLRIELERQRLQEVVSAPSAYGANRDAQIEAQRSLRELEARESALVEEGMALQNASAVTRKIDEAKAEKVLEESNPRRRGGGGASAADRQRLADERNDYAAMYAQMMRGSNAGSLEGVEAVDINAYEQGTEKDVELRQKLADIEANRLDTARQQKELNAEQTEELERQLQMVEFGAAKVGDAMGSMWESAITGSDLFTKQALENFAVQEGKLALSALAMAIGNTIFNPAGAAAKYTEAAMHGALAAGGLVGLGIAGAGGGGGGHGGRGAVDDRSSSRVLGAGSREDDRGGGNTYHIHLQTFAAGTMADVGREIRGALRAAERHDGVRI